MAGHPAGVALIGKIPDRLHARAYIVLLLHRSTGDAGGLALPHGLAWSRACRHAVPPGFRATPHAANSVTAVRLRSSRLRAWRRCAPACGKPRPAAMGGLVGLRPGLLRQVVPKRAVLDAGSSSPVRHEGRFTDTPPGLAMALPRHASSKRPPATSGAFTLSLGVVLARARAQAGEAVTREAESAMFLSERVGPRRPVCL